MRLADKNIWRSLLLIVPAWLLLHANLGAAPEAKAAPAMKPPAKSKASASTSKKSTKKSSRSLRRRRPSSFKRRIARMALQPERVAEIQRSLVDADYLHQEPTGKWDAASRDAMLRYQADHGFPATGLPEAKSLMKLGLGPHPLPADVDPSAQAHARAETPEAPDGEIGDGSDSEVSPP